MDFEADEESPPERRLSERLFEGGVKVRASLDWSKVSLPALVGPPLRPGEAAPMGEEALEYGHHEVSG